jgi:hypothetical protein
LYDALPPVGEEDTMTCLFMQTPQGVQFWNLMCSMLFQLRPNDHHGAHPYSPNVHASSPLRLSLSNPAIAQQHAWLVMYISVLNIGKYCNLHDSVSNAP